MTFLTSSSWATTAAASNRGLAEDVKAALPRHHLAVKSVKVKRSADYDGLESIAKKLRFEDPHMPKLREKLTAQLEAPKETSVDVDNIKSLLEAISAEKIALKGLAKKRTAIKGGKDDNSQENDFKANLNLDVDTTKAIISRERQGRTRTTILQSSDKTFENILVMLDTIKISEEGEQRPPQEAPVVMPLQTPESPTQPATYNCNDQERLNRQEEGRKSNIIIHNVCANNQIVVLSVHGQRWRHYAKRVKASERASAVHQQSRPHIVNHINFRALHA